MDFHVSEAQDISVHLQFKIVATIQTAVPNHDVLKQRSKFHMDKGNPEALFEKYGDIVKLKQGYDLSPDDYKKFKIWDNGEIPYFIDIPSFPDKALRDKIRWFLNEVNSMTSLNFLELPRPPIDYFEKRWVYFMNRASHLPCQDISIQNFTSTGVQRVVLGYDCLTKGGGLAEIVLALAGVPAQHNAPNRDEYIFIEMDNILPEKKYLFRKLENNEWIFHNLIYDYESAGHFHNHKHTVNGLLTIRNLMNLNKTHMFSLDQDEGFSYIDIIKLNLLYNYIIRKGKNNLPACRKIYTSLKNSTSLLPFEPIPKPNKYLGIESPEIDGENSNKSENSNNSDRNKISEETDEKMPNKSEDSNSSENTNISEEINGESSNISEDYNNSKNTSISEEINGENSTMSENNSDHNERSARRKRLKYL